MISPNDGSEQEVSYKRRDELSFSHIKFSFLDSRLIFLIFKFPPDHCGSMESAATTPLLENWTEKKVSVYLSVSRIHEF
jgi:hypothetical protein